jgi:molecular chaperone DnaK (HSP70)
VDCGAKPTVGFDFGTSTSLVASQRGVVPIGDSVSWLPSVVGLGDDDGVVVGDEAAGLPDEQIVRSIKRSITERRDYVRVDTPSGIRDMRSDDLIPAILREAARRAEARSPGLLGRGDLRLGCPAMWDGRQRRRLLEVAERAGLSVGLASLVDEPVAAGVAWLADRAASGFGVNGPTRIVVFDMGGGTLDIAVLDVRGLNHRELSVLAAIGVPEAGDALDDAIAEDLGYALEAAGVNVDALSHPERARTLLKGYAREAKIELSRETKTPVSLLRGLFGIGSIWYSRDQLNAVFAPQIDRAEEYIAVALKVARLTEAESDTTYNIMHTPLRTLTDGVTHVVLSGGMSQIPYVSERLRAFFPPTTAVEMASASPEEAVVVGLARAAAYGRINMYRPSFDVYLEWDGGREVRAVYDAYTPLFESGQIARGGHVLGYRRNGLDLSLPRKGKGKLRVVSQSGERVRATLGGKSLDRFPVELSEQRFEFRIYCNGRIRLTDGSGTYEGQIDDWYGSRGQ